MLSRTFSESVRGTMSLYVVASSMDRSCDASLLPVHHFTVVLGVMPIGKAQHGQQSLVKIYIKSMFRYRGPGEEQSRSDYFSAGNNNTAFSYRLAAQHRNHNRLLTTQKQACKAVTVHLQIRQFWRGRTFAFKKAKWGRSSMGTNIGGRNFQCLAVKNSTPTL